MSVSKKELRELDFFIKTSKDAREIKRGMAIKQYLLGIEQKKIAELLGVSQPFVSKWNMLYKAKGIGGLKLQYKGSFSRISDEERAAVTNWIKQRASLTIKELQKHVQDIYGVKYASSQSYYALMTRAKYSHKKSQKINPKRDEKLVKEKSVKK